jgi:hypothetical protein
MLDSSFPLSYLFEGFVSVLFLWTEYKEDRESSQRDQPATEECEFLRTPSSRQYWTETYPAAMEHRESFAPTMKRYQELLNSKDLRVLVVEPGEAE